MRPWIAVAAVLAMGAAAAWRADAQSGGISAGPAGIATPELITHFLPGEGQPTQLTVIDPGRRVLAVYHIARDTGVVELKSVRAFQWDLQLDEHNGTKPLPKEIRNQLQRTPPQ